jgi:hypothetical protein
MGHLRRALADLFHLQLAQFARWSTGQPTATHNPNPKSRRRLPQIARSHIVAAHCRNSRRRVLPQIVARSPNSPTPHSRRTPPQALPLSRASQNRCAPLLPPRAPPSRCAPLPKITTRRAPHPFQTLRTAEALPLNPCWPP